MLDYLIKGGPVMVPLILCSIFLVAVLLERRKTLEVLRMDTTDLRRRLRELLHAGKVEDGLKLCGESPSPVAEVLGIGLRRWQHLKAAGRSDDQAEVGMVKAMEDYVPHVINRLERYLGALFIVGNVAPLLGFLGTVTGMIRCFKAIASTGGMRPDAIAGGISEALITCAAGLMVAIPAFVAYHHFSTRIKDFAVELDTASTEMVEATTAKPSSEAADAPRR